ncbi:Tfp pilus assembly protein PilN [Sanguibacter gelidistatuariae]|uniref:Tfp pilus assembly protein PilN n=1 Tax=Sanguibacter gelidistatuariae TaxID=1814289 RepID=A0A1G6JRD1_9MICO|nr:hypothetical protein [Sanguibacter gelidistatuariae]SDC21247.1 Tfp pilus assembly protein PilN [Sanguibacter gelidistatuariae]
MSTTKLSQNRAGVGGYTPVIAGASRLPQVNLLPPSIRARRQLQRLKVRLLFVLGAVMVLGVAIWFTTANIAINAQTELENEQMQTSKLLREQAKYAAVPAIKGQIGDALLARTFVTGHDIFWKSLTDQIMVGLPEGVVVGVIDIATTTPLAGAPAAPDPITDQGVATVTVAVESPTVLDTSAWLDVLDEIPGFMEATFSTATLGENDDLEPIYEVQAMVQVDTSVFANRFSEEGTG